MFMCTIFVGNFKNTKKYISDPQQLLRIDLTTIRNLIL